jgi:hypothetical protein
VLLSQQEALLQHSEDAQQVQLPLLVLLGQAAAHGHDLSRADLGGLVGRAKRGWEALRPAVQQRAALAMCQLGAYPAAQAAAPTGLLHQLRQLESSDDVAAAQAAKEIALAVEAASGCGLGQQLAEALLQQGVLERVQALLQRDATQHGALVVSIVRLVCEHLRGAVTACSSTARGSASLLLTEVVLTHAHSRNPAPLPPPCPAAGALSCSPLMAAAVRQDPSLPCQLLDYVARCGPFNSAGDPVQQGNRLVVFVAPSQERTARDAR